MRLAILECDMPPPQTPAAFGGMGDVLGDLFAQATLYESLVNNLSTITRGRRVQEFEALAGLVLCIQRELRILPQPYANYALKWRRPTP